MKINIGSGRKQKVGWVNIDQDKQVFPDVVCDVTKEFIFSDNSLEFCYNEHFIEHISMADAIILCKKIHKALQPNGVLRIATPDLDYLCEKYISDWQEQYWLKDFPQLSTRCLMMNSVFYEWGHKFIYNEEQLRSMLNDCGFNKIERVGFGESLHEGLKNLETRPDSKLILEATKKEKKWLI